MLTLKQIKKEVEKQGLNFDEWRKNIIDKKMLALISKEKDYYSYWELRELNDSLFKLLLNKSSNKNNSYRKMIVRVHIKMLYQEVIKKLNNKITKRIRDPTTLILKKVVFILFEKSFNTNLSVN